MGSADFNLVLTTADVFVPVKYSSFGHSQLNHEVFSCFEVSALVNGLGDLELSFKHLVGTVVVRPNNNSLTIDISASSHVQAKSTIAERNPVVRSSALVFPLHVSAPFGSSHNNEGSSGILSFFNTKSKASVFVVSDVSGFLIEDPDLTIIILRLANRNIILSSTDVSVEVQDSAVLHLRLNHEGSVLWKTTANEQRLFGVVVHLEPLVDSVMAAPHHDMLVFNVFSIPNVHA